MKLLSEATVPPFVVADDVAASEELRLKYRYLDLRRPALQANLGLRHRVTMAVRKYFDAQGFWEIETPMLTKSTPEGARDYLVPSRVHPGDFYALPQSPQIFKQILMIAGHRPLLPDRRGASATRTCAPTASPSSRRSTSRCPLSTRELVFAVIERLMARDLQGARPGDRDAVSAHRLRRGDRALRIRQAGPALRHGDRGRIARCSPESTFSVFREAVAERRRSSAASSCPAAAGVSRKAARRAGRGRAGSLAPEGWSGSRRNARLVQSSALKAAGEATLGAAPRRRWRRAGRPPAAGRGAGRRHRRGARADLRLQWPGAQAG